MYIRCRLQTVTPGRILSSTDDTSGPEKMLTPGAGAPYFPENGQSSVDVSLLLLAVLCVAILEVIIVAFCVISSRKYKTNRA
jgi:hypothetical protein